MIRLALILLLASTIAGGTASGLASRLIHRGSAAVVRATDGTDRTGCKRPSGVVSIGFSKTKFPTIRSHELSAIRHGYPRVLTIERDGASQRREHLLESVPTRPGYDRDEWPAAVLRKTWHADVAYVPSSENRSQGAQLGAKIRKYCDGTKIVYAWY
jgi:hypothetical protein